MKPPGLTLHKVLPVLGSILSRVASIFWVMSIWREYLMFSGSAVVVLTYNMPLSSKNRPTTPTDGSRQRALPVAMSNAVKTA